ncbi:conserved Plasmodium protein, unknown function [Plasmodium gallinaceum]|uniref:Uncharacterized protein n=1 Tax=Plasmodium gallinaceum TaxID=5849 RepID=A0A1J1GQ92_PLAGA|nr:conserved Plasmodium protein, unknown function [Plasmodium gallinaceum]CRG94671.1 conserved Plasmodium protein, unknown function [Plasmodium gallinaceum]
MERSIFYIFIIFIWIFHSPVNCQICTTDICQRCCYPTEDGCENNFIRTFRGNFNSGSTYCQQCDCKNPITGCGWVAEKYEKIKCTSCTFIKHASLKIKYFDISGCGYHLENGKLVNAS